MKRREIKVLVTAGPTREYFDPVRFLSNPSTGKMGYALAEAAYKKGHEVVVVSGPSSLPSPPCRRLLHVTSAQEMHRVVKREAPSADVILMTAAVCDYRPLKYFSRKIKKTGRKRAFFLSPTPDILKELGRRKKPGQILVGFAAETDHLVENASRKLREKNLDLIVANRVGCSSSGFENDRNRVLLISRDGRQTIPPGPGTISKKQLALTIWRLIKERLREIYY